MIRSLAGLPTGQNRVLETAGLHDFWSHPSGISIALLWFVPTSDRLAAFAWIAFTFILFDTLWTITNVPYYALTSELTDDYDERSSLTTYRMVMAVPAYLVRRGTHPGHRRPVRPSTNGICLHWCGLWGFSRSGIAHLGCRFSRAEKSRSDKG